MLGGHRKETVDGLQLAVKPRFLSMTGLVAVLLFVFARSSARSDGAVTV
jgi:hypothetical protein